jgi:DNA (cytosine-5)-methyltransferase 1
MCQQQQFGDQGFRPPGEGAPCPSGLLEKTSGTLYIAKRCVGLPQNEITVNLKIPAISLFTGAGGLDLGFALEGFDIRVAVETDPSACDTLKKNWRGIAGRLIQRPLEAIPTRELLRIAALRPGEAGVVFGGPPCQSWCVAGNRLGLADERGRSIIEFCRVVREARPQAFCLENVPGLLSIRSVKVLQLIDKEINGSRRSTYSISAQVLNAAEYGVPQVRKRVFIVGSLTCGEFYFPTATHQLVTGPQRAERKRAICVASALRGLPPPDKPSAQAHRVAATIGARNERWYARK